ncbi:hypothetical protein AB1Y20_021143 [Prymnesium parvum]|uniref:Uncharacterized protein n=1 Tax=Prymnesium parvum TaxID=97485 RepID=A0AB34JHY4_PRYPA
MMLRCPPLRAAASWGPPRRAAASHEVGRWFRALSTDAGAGSSTATPAASSPAPAAAPSTPPSTSPSSDAASAEKQGFESRDIAFKPNSDGWGYTPAYAKSWDRIFGSKKKGGES